VSGSRVFACAGLGLGIAIVLLARLTPVAQTAVRPAAPLTRATPHLTFIARLSHRVAVAGTRMSIVVDVTPKKGMHVYAPGQQYRPVAIRLTPDTVFRIHEPVYPKPTVFTFKPLNEEVLVYEAPFRLVLDITPGDTAEQRAALRRRGRLPVKAKLEYQACDDAVCYLPMSVPFEWTVGVTP